MILHRKLYTVESTRYRTHLVTMIMCMRIIVMSMLQFDSQLLDLIPHSGDVRSDNDLILDGEAGEYCLDVFWEGHI